MLFFFVIFITFIFSYSVIQAAEVVKENTPAWQNIQKAADFLRDMGYSGTADNVIEWLNKGKIYSGSIADNAETSNLTRDITIATNFIQGPGKNKVFTDFESIMVLARILLHEKVHAHQNYFFVGWSAFGKNSAEIEAWGVSIRAMDSWIYQLVSKYNMIPKDKRKEKLEALKKILVVVNEKKTYVEIYIKDHNYFNGDRAGFSELLEKLREFSRELERAKSDLEPEQSKSESPDFGKLIEEDKILEEYALKQMPVIPKDNEVEVTYCGQGKASGHIFDVIIDNKTDRKIKTEIPLGLVLVPSDPKYQIMILGETAYVTLEPKSTAKRALYGYCLEHSKLPPPFYQSNTALRWTHPESSAPFTQVKKIIITGNRLSKEGKYASDIMSDQIQYRTTIIQRALWYFITKGTEKEVGRTKLIEDMDKALKKQDAKDTPEPEKEKVINRIWDDIDLTVKESN